MTFSRCTSFSRRSTSRRSCCTSVARELLLLLPALIPFVWISSTTIIFGVYVPVAAFEGHVGGRPVVDRRAIAGVWSLRTKPAYPMKEFTVYPKSSPPVDDEAELLLMLKEDGSFRQCNDDTSSSRHDPDDDDDDSKLDIDASWSRFKQLKKRIEARDASLPLQNQLMHGTWDFVDGKLILAADRVQVTASDNVRANARETRTQSSGSNLPLSLSQPNENGDTLLVGRVVASYETRLQDNPQVSKTTTSTTASATNAANERKEELTATPSSTEATTTPSSRRGKVALDTHLSVPTGSVKVGRFFYPRSHPSFFEQPMFQPKRQGTFSLRQVLGSLNTAIDRDDQEQEKFQCADFYNKTFSLTSHPIAYKPKGKLRWSIRQNKMVRDPPPFEAAKAAEAAENRPVDIRVMLVQFHANNTFSTVAGLGESILRGKFDIIGKEKDQLWMQVWRFGFGRSVSGSVYSEGRMLTHEDAKTYWGEIRYEQKQEKSSRQQQLKDDDSMPDPLSSGADKTVREESTVLESDSGQKEAELPPRLEVKGSVLIGWGVEPTPEARFIMREATDESLDFVDEEEDDDEEEDEERFTLGKDSDAGLDDGIDWSSKDSFQ